MVLHLLLLPSKIPQIKFGARKKRKCLLLCTNLTTSTDARWCITDCVPLPYSTVYKPDIFIWIISRWGTDGECAGEICIMFQRENIQTYHFEVYSQEICIVNSNSMQLGRIPKRGTLRFGLVTLNMGKMTNHDFGLPSFQTNGRNWAVANLLLVNYHRDYVSSIYQWYRSRRWRKFQNRKPIGDVGRCDSRMAEGIHWWTER